MRKIRIEECTSLTPFDVKNKLILYPTETIYGLGCSLFDVESTEKIGIAKQRDPNKKYIQLVDSIDRIAHLLQLPIPLPIQNLLASGLSVTVLLEPSSSCPIEYIDSNNKLLSVRVTKHPLCLDLIRLLDAPLLSTSANISGQSSTTHFSEISKDLLLCVDLVIDAGDIPLEIPSTIVEYRDLDFIIIRQGSVTYDQIAVFL